MTRTTRDEVLWAYRLLLGREPESERIVDEHMRATDGSEQLVRNVLSSAEFAQRGLIHSTPRLSGGERPRRIDIDGPEEQLSKLFEHVRKSWQHLGKTDAFHSVLTSPEYRGRPAAEAIAMFLRSGAGDLERFLATLEDHDIAFNADARCLEFGCGLGRVTHHLRRRFENVTAVDVSAAHLSLARQLADDAGVEGIHWTHLESLASLKTLPQFDIIYSIIVLQHNPPPVMDRILRAFAELLRPGGVAYFQVPTYRSDYEFNLGKYVRHQVGRKSMEMHVFPQQRIFSLFAQAGAVPVLVFEDGMTGWRAGERSNTFLFQRNRG